MSQGLCSLALPVSQTDQSTNSRSLKKFARRKRSESEPYLSPATTPPSQSSSSYSVRSVSSSRNGTVPSSPEVPLVFGKRLFPGEGRYEGFLSFDGMRMGRGRLCSFDDTVTTKSTHGSWPLSKSGMKKGLQYEYDGEWKDDKPHGTGVFRNHLTFDRYSGGYADGKRHGLGVFLWGNGDKYTGNFQNGTMHGTGRIDWANGDSYQGEWKQGSATGKGVRIGADGTHCEGQFRNGFAHGLATKSWAHGDRFVGELVDDVIEGFGSYCWREGHRYEGSWKDDQFHGIGKYTSAVRIGNKNVEYTTFLGEFRRGEQHGLGVVTVEGSDSLYCGEVYEQLQGDNEPLSHISSLQSLSSSLSLLSQEDTSMSNQVNAKRKNARVNQQVRIVYGLIQYESGLKYSGDCLDAVRHGSGTMSFTPSECEVVNDEDILPSSSQSHNNNAHNHMTTQSTTSIQSDVFLSTSSLSSSLAQLDWEAHVNQWTSIPHIDISTLDSEDSVERLLLSRGGYFCGNYVDDLVHGCGRFVFLNGQSFVAEYVDGLFVSARYE